MAEIPRTVPVFEVHWLRLFPWLRLFRVPGAAADPKSLMLAALGLVATAAGWEALDRAFPASAGLTPLVFPARKPIGPDSLPSVGWWLSEPLRLVSSPFFTLFDTPAGFGRTAHAALAALWVVVVWGLIGGAIARVAVVKLARGERVGLGEAFDFAARKALPLIGTPLIPLMGVGVVAASLAVFAQLYRLPAPLGPTAAGLLAFLPLLGGLLLTLILIGLMAGWPLMQASVAAEAEDGFDAISRTYAYLHQRPWHYAGYTALAFAVGCVGLVFVDVFARMVVHLTAWGLSLAGPGATVAAYYGGFDGDTLPADLGAHRFWLAVVSTLVRAWVYSAFWTAATAAYLLLRRDVDSTPFDKIAYTSRPGPLDEVAPGAAAGPVPEPVGPESHAAGSVLAAGDVRADGPTEGFRPGAA